VDYRASLGRILTGRASDHLLDAGSRLLYNERMRLALIKGADKWFEHKLNGASRGSAGMPRTTWEKYVFARAVLHSMDRQLNGGLMNPNAARRAGGLWSKALFAPPDGKPAVQRFVAERGCQPPWLMVISPGHACNLSCPGCYAASTSASAKLPWSTLDRLITQAKQLWGVPLLVFSGGEPLLYRSEGKDLLDMAEKHPDILMLIFTNGTLVDRRVAERLERIGTTTLAISVEGMRERTDAMRGAGAFDRVLQAMDHLHERGVLTGISATVTRDNWQELTSGRFIDFFFGDQSAFYAFFFHYMPIGRGCSFDLMPTPQQRLELWRRTWEIVEQRNAFIFDFWNFGSLVHGCVSAGRERGYIYVDWNGKVMPCVFSPYSVGNIQELFREGRDLNDLLDAPFFLAIRQWQQDYGYGNGNGSEHGNLLRPCPIRDHYGMYREWIDLYRPEPENEAAREALADEGYVREMVAYGEELERLSLGIWQREYC
jgi:MoaA/NifB/PqqE/SkfB family radical SAM enzyme